jgi:hypothetical protein
MLNEKLNARLVGARPSPFWYELRDAAGSNPSNKQQHCNSDRKAPYVPVFAGRLDNG